VSSQLTSPMPISPAPATGQFGPDLPRDYGVTRLVILPRDPQWVHAYWEVAPHTWEEAEREFGGRVRTLGRPVLRFQSLREADTRVFDVGVNLDARHWYVSCPVRGGWWKAELGLLLPDGRFVLLAASNEIRLPSGQVSQEREERWGLMGPDWQRLFELSGGGRLGVGSLDVAKMLSQRWDFLRSVSSWAGSPGGFVGSRGADQRKSFWLVADCELVVYGATEPSARVTVQGRPVPLNPDGTFTARFALPDGRLDIPIEAVNQDGDLSEAVDFTVDRETRRS
jgi:uncharacterized protein